MRNGGSAQGKPVGSPVSIAGYATSVPILAAATDRIDGRWLYVGCAPLGAVASFAFALGAHSFLTALMLRLLGGVAVAGVHMPGLKLLIDRTSGVMQGRGAAVYTSSYAAGNSVSFLVAGIATRPSDGAPPSLLPGSGRFCRSQRFGCYRRRLRCAMRPEDLFLRLDRCCAIAR